MKIVDANVLLYAVNADTAQHHDARRWLDHALSGHDTVGFTWIALVAFLRLSTKIGLLPSPLSTGEAIDQIHAWLGAPGARLVEPTGQHLAALAQILSQVGTGGNLVNDAHLAAVAVEQRGAVVSFDNDFGRFKGVRWQSPVEL